MRKTLLIVVVVVIAITALFYFVRSINDTGEDNYPHASLVSCLADRGVLVYGSRTCPACVALIDQFGGYDVIEPIYVECADDHERCIEEMQGRYVPEIQIGGEIYNGPRTPEALAEITRCD